MREVTMGWLCNLKRETVNDSYVRFEVLTTAKVTMLFWIVTPCRLAGRYPSFRETYCLHPQSRRWILYVSHETL